jgi:3-hydroxyisobutyrate dehydrogenase
MTRRVGFIGLGNMGGRMTRRLLGAGVDVVGFDVRADVIAEIGATPASSAAHVADEADLVLLSLPDSRIVERVVYGDGALLAALRPGTIVVDLSTSSPASTRRIAADAAARDVAWIDAGISGGAAAAERGALTLMVGGDESALEAARPTLDHVAAKIVHCGAVGAGHTVKLLNNFLNAVTLSATAEVMIAAKKADLDLATVLEVVNASSGASFASRERFPHIIQGDYLEGGLTSTLMLKDVTLYLDLVAELGVASLNAPGPVAAFGLARALGYADQISNRVVDAIGDVSGGVRLHEPAAAATEAEETP